MLKKFLVLFISFILIFNCITPAYASNLIDDLVKVPGKDINIQYDANIDGTSSPKTEESQKSSKANSMLQIILDIIESAMNILTSPIKSLIMLFPTIEDSIWAESRTVQLTFFNASTSVASMADGFRSVVGSVYNGLRYLVAAIYVIILVYLGVRMILSSMGRQKAQYKMMLQHWLMGLLLLFAFHWVMAFIIWISYQLTDAFRNLGTVAFTSYAFTDNSRITGFIINQIAKDSGSLALLPGIGTLLGIAWGIIGLIILIVFGFVIFFTYLKRMFTVALLIVLFPLVVLSYVFDKMGDRKAQTFSTWFREFTVNVFLQPIHAFLLAMIAFVLNVSGSVWELVPLFGSIISFLLLTLIPMGEKQIKTLFQINSSMGPGNSGIAGSLAHAGMALDTIQKGAKALTTGRQNLKNFSDIKRLVAGDKVKTIGQDAFNKEMKKLNSNPMTKNLSKEEKEKRANKARERAENKFLRSRSGRKHIKQSIKDGKISEDLQAEIKNRTGYDSFEEASAALQKKMLAKSVGAGVGIGHTLATTTSAGDLLKNVIGSGIAGATLGDTLYGTVKDLKAAGNPPKSPELDKAIKSNEKGNLDKLSDAEKENIEKVLGIDKNLLKESTPGIHDLINKRIKARKEALQYGIAFDNPLVNSFDPDYTKIQNIKAGKEADGSGNIDWKNYDRIITKTGTYVKNKQTGELIQVGKGNPNAGDNAIWEEGSDLTHKDFAKDLENLSETRIKEIASRLGIDEKSDRYKKLVNEETKNNAAILRAHTAAFDSLMGVPHDMLTQPAFKAFDDCTFQFDNFDDARAKMSTEQVHQVLSSYQNYAADLTSASSSRDQIIKKVSALEAGGLSSVQSICGADYSSFMAGSLADDTRFNQIAQQVQAAYMSAGADYQKAVVANVVDMEARANSMISGLFGDTTKTMSQAAIASAVSQTIPNADISGFTSTQLQGFMSNLTIQQQQLLSNNLSIMGQAEARAMPDTSKIINASNQGLITTSVNIGNESDNFAKVFDPTSGEKILVSATVGPVNPTTGLASMTVTSLGNPSQSITFDTDIDTGGSLTNTYGGEISLDADGNIQLLRTDGTADYTFTPPASASNAQPFYEFDLEELRTMCNNSDETFSIIKYGNICAVLNSQGEYCAVKRGSEQAKESKLIQYTISKNSSGDLEYTTSAPSSNIYKLHLKARDKSINPDDVSLLKELLGIK